VNKIPIEIEIRRGEKGYVVRPGTVKAHPGDVLQLHNGTRGYVLLYFPPSAPFRENTQRIEPGRTLELQIPRVKARDFPYAAYTWEGNDFCEGNSSPRIIILP
jgi:hypothetical protein